MVTPVLGRDHTTVIQAFDAVKNSIDIQDSYFFPHVEPLTIQIKEVIEYNSTKPKSLDLMQTLRKLETPFFYHRPQLLTN